MDVANIERQLFESSLWSAPPVWSVGHTKPTLPGARFLALRAWISPRTVTGIYFVCLLDGNGLSFFGQMKHEARRQSFFEADFGPHGLYMAGEAVLVLREKGGFDSTLIADTAKMVNVDDVAWCVRAKGMFR
jgi:hypothetical protein